MEAVKEDLRLGSQSEMTLLFVAGIALVHDLSQLYNETVMLLRNETREQFCLFDTFEQSVFGNEENLREILELTLLGAITINDLTLATKTIKYSKDLVIVLRSDDTMIGLVLSHCFMKKDPINLRESLKNGLVAVMKQNTSNPFIPTKK